MVETNNGKSIVKDIGSSVKATVLYLKLRRYLVQYIHVYSCTYMPAHYTYLIQFVRKNHYLRTVIGDTISALSSSFSVQMIITLLSLFQNFGDSCVMWRRFANLWETSQSLFWASFGLVELGDFELKGIKEFTR